MRTFAQKPKATQQNTSAKSPMPDRTHLGQSREVNSILYLQRTIGNQAVQKLLQAEPDGHEAVSDATASGRFGHDFSQIPVHAKASVKIQPKLAVNTPGDIYEQEADRVSDEVMHMPEPQLQRACPSSPLCPQCQTKQPGEEHDRLLTKRVQASDAGQIAAPPIVDEILNSPGQALDSATRAFMEPRFGRDFSNVRVHTDSRAAESADAVQATAYTVGSHLVFAQGQYALGAASGRQLIAHELTHVAQQQVPDPVVRRQPAPKPIWKDIWPRFQAAKASDPTTATTLAEQLAAAARDDDDLRFQGLDVIAWLRSHGKTEKAVILLFDLRALLAFDVGQKQKLPNWVGEDQTFRFSELLGTGALSGATPQRPIDPRVLIDAGRSAAAAGQHREALQFLGSANEILSLYALQVTRGGHSNAYAFREGRYAELSTIYDALRDIYQVYPQLEREARAAGKEKRADSLHTRGEELRHATLKQFAAVGEAQVAETDFVSRRTGAAYQLVGANKETTELTQLPGLSAPSELDSGVRVQDLSEIQTALMKQADVQEELRDEPEIAKAFPKRPIDLNDNTTRRTSGRSCSASTRTATAMVRSHR